MKNLAQFEKAMKENTILKGFVKVVQFDRELDTDILILDLNGVKGIIVRDEVDLEVNWKSLTIFIGREVSFMVKEIDSDKGVVICSRKDAQAVLKESIVERLREGEVFNAQVINILRYGAYVEIDGVTGLLKNIDFAEDYTSIGEVLKVGDSVNVKLKKISSNNRLIFEAIEKYKNPTIMEFDMLERDQVTFGVVRNVKPFGVYVNIAPGVDALAPLPGTGEIEEGMKVSFRITQVRPEEKRVRGKIVKIL
ncbi:S1 RNA-binding domain-containing protein (plasmid) [Paenibacillus thiaminolyticus]|uniref:S1 RNA-binding domain-containing protein n=1 Tax=Paenibacillus thiaminolyticus TaxID=49283 RepID=UPI00233128D3|nr:S1 RNA-binding domain-containing protein [Paenibacillus thiaminolyticus]WCF11755.1 S1 RNA-binding domain-containing protein [Paenibacillus thiaminolyticus]